MKGDIILDVIAAFIVNTRRLAERKGVSVDKAMDMEFRRASKLRDKLSVGFSYAPRGMHKGR